MSNTMHNRLSFFDFAWLNVESTTGSNQWNIQHNQLMSSASILVRNKLSVDLKTRLSLKSRLHIAIENITDDEGI
jgi:hypothetical protein